MGIAERLGQESCEESRGVQTDRVGTDAAGHGRIAEVHAQPPFATVSAQTPAAMACAQPTADISRQLAWKTQGSNISRIKDPPQSLGLGYNRRRFLKSFGNQEVPA